MKDNYEEILREANSVLKRKKTDLRILKKVEQKLELLCFEELNSASNLRFFGKEGERYYRAAAVRSCVKSRIDELNMEAARLGSI